MAVHLGIQLYSVRESLAADPRGTFERLAELGFTHVESANLSADQDDGIGLGLSADQLSELLSASGIQLVGSHVSTLDLSRIERILDVQAGLGTLGIGPDIQFFPHQDVDFVRRRSDLYNRIGELCKQRGMRFYYHNHFQEFQLFGDRTVFELIMDNTDPELVMLEMDTYWVYRAGEDPLEWIERYPDRLMLTHQKDFPANAPQPMNLYDGVVSKNADIDFDLFSSVLDSQCFTEVGTGVLPIQSVIDAVAQLPNFRYMLLEQDLTNLGEFESVRVSRDAFARYAGVAWD